MNRETRREPDRDLSQSMVALRRAAQQARLDAERTHTPFVTYANGTVVKQMLGESKSEQGESPTTE